MAELSGVEDFRAACQQADVHTVEVAAPDTLGHLRGKRVPVERYFRTIADHGLHIADAIFVFDIQNDLADNPYINMDAGFLDCHLVPDVSTGRLFSHRPGYALVFADTLRPPRPSPPRRPPQCVGQPGRALPPSRAGSSSGHRTGVLPVQTRLGTVQDHIQYSSLTDAMDLEDCLHDMRAALLGAGLEVESSNPEYGPGQVEINIEYADAMTCADNTVLFKSIVKQVAVQHGLRATFIPKLWTDQSGSGMHVHTSLANADGGANAFASSDGRPNQIMEHWVAGLIEHAPALTLLGSPNVNGAKRIRPYTFVPTHIHWGLDNRSVMCRCICEAGSNGNRVEFRSAGADANPHAIIAAILAAGLDGIESELALPPMSEGDMYADPGDTEPLPSDLPGAIAAFRGSSLAEMLGEEFSTTFLLLAEHELALATENSPHPDEVNDWERARYAEHC